MHIDPYIVLGSAIIGLLVGMTGAGGGALMTPMLILLFGIKPSTAISSDLVAAVVMRPIGASVHMRAGTVNFKLVRWLVIGSVPCAFAGAYLLHLIGHAKSAENTIEIFLGTALLVGAGAMGLRFVLDRRAGGARTGFISDVTARPLPTLMLGMVGGIIVGMTSVGSGSLMIVGLLFIYPRIGANQLVGTDLTQAVPLTFAAALGALAFGHVELSVTGSLILGSVPAVLVGSLLSSRIPDRYIRPVIAFAIFASGLKYIGVDTTALGWILCATLARRSGRVADVRASVERALPRQGDLGASSAFGLLAGSRATQRGVARARPRTARRCHGVRERWPWHSRCCAPRLLDAGRHKRSGEYGQPRAVRGRGRLCRLGRVDLRRALAAAGGHTTAGSGSQPTGERVEPAAPRRGRQHSSPNPRARGKVRGIVCPLGR